MEEKVDEGIEMAEILQDKPQGGTIHSEMNENLDEESEEGAAGDGAWEDDEDDDLVFDLDKPLRWDPAEDIPIYLRGRNHHQTELEEYVQCDSRNFAEAPFQTLQLFTGQDGGWFGERKGVGFVKGLWKLTQSQESPFGKGMQTLLKKQIVDVRLYVLTGVGLFPMDSDNFSDPYIIVKLGNEEHSTRDRYLPNTLDPDFYECFTFHIELPGPSQLIIEVWDWDGIGDDLIGITAIDIEDRWFSKTWRKLNPKPTEERTLYNPRSKAAYGTLKLWLDMFDQQESRVTPVIDITPPPKEDFEMRIICWKARETRICDEITNQNDLYATIHFDMEDCSKQDTDLHFRAKDGFGSWNWRMKWDFKLPSKKQNRLRISMWDMDFTAADDLICEMNLDISTMMKYAYKMKDRVVMKKKTKQYPDYDPLGLNEQAHAMKAKLALALESGDEYGDGKPKDRFWLDMLHPSYDGIQGKLQFSLEIMPKEAADALPAGVGRSSPNTNPFLPEPDGRFQWSLNPFTILRQLLGDQCLMKLCGVLCCIASVFLCYFWLMFKLPDIIAAIIAAFFNDPVGFILYGLLGLCVASFACYCYCCSGYFDDDDNPGCFSRYCSCIKCCC